MLFQIRRKGPLAPKYFLQSFNGTPHLLVRLDTLASQGASSSGTSFVQRRRKHKNSGEAVVKGVRAKRARF